MSSSCSARFNFYSCPLVTTPNGMEGTGGARVMSIGTDSSHLGHVLYRLCLGGKLTLLGTWEKGDYASDD